MSVSYFRRRWDRSAFSRASATIHFLGLHHFTRITWRRWPGLISRFRRSRYATTYRRLRNMPSSGWHWSLTDWRATTRLSNTVDIHFLVTRMFPTVWIFVLSFQKLFVPIFIGWLKSRFLHDVVNLLALTCWMRWIWRCREGLLWFTEVLRSSLELTRNSCGVWLSIHTHIASDPIVGTFIVRTSSTHWRHWSQLLTRCLD